MCFLINKGEYEIKEGLYQPLKELYTLHQVKLDKYKNSWFKKIIINGQEYNVLDQEKSSYIGNDDRIHHSYIVKTMKLKDGNLSIKFNNIVALFDNYYII